MKHGTRPLHLNDREFFETVWKTLRQIHHLRFADFSFASNYLFRHQEEFQVIDYPVPLLYGTNRENIPYIIPSHEPAELQKLAKQLDLTPDVSFFPICTAWKEKEAPGIFRQCAFESDYIYSREKLASMAGRQLSSRRNLIAQLEKEHGLQVRPITAETVSDAHAILESWQKNTGLPQQDTDYFPAKEALELFQELQLFGRIIYVDGAAAGYTLGEVITSETALLLFAKSDHAVKGLTPYAYRDFANILPPSIQWINFEEDLGNANLRQAKEAYGPEEKLEKWYYHPLT